MSDFDTDMDDAYLEAPIAPSQYHSHDTELLLERLRDMIDSAPNVPLSSTPRIRARRPPTCSTRRWCASPRSSRPPVGC